LTPRRVQLELRLADGRGTASLDGATERLHQELVAVHDDDGRQLAREATGGLGRALSGRLRPPADHPLVDSVARQLERFAAALRGEPADPLASAREGAVVMATIEAARRSVASDGDWEPVRT
jgi:predicted dehydrogenase